MTVSWLTLERYALGDLDAAGVAAVERALADDPEAQERLATIEGDDRPLPPFPVGDDSGLPLPEPAPQPPRGEVVQLWPRLAAGLATAAALAAAALFAMQAPPTHRAKGGDLTLSVVTEDGRVVKPGQVVPVGTAIQAYVTWDPGPAHGELTADGAPLWSGPLAGRNRERIDGAWVVEEGPVELCAHVADQRACVQLTGGDPTEP